MSEDIWFLNFSGPHGLMCEMAFDSEEEARKNLELASKIRGGGALLTISSLNGDFAIDASAYTVCFISSYKQVVDRARLMRKISEEANKTTMPQNFRLNN